MEVRYIHTKIVHNTNAAEQIVPDIIKKFNPKSVIDVGCGTGTWLNIFELNGVDDVLGVDGDYVDRSMLMIEDKKFLSADLRKEFSLQRKFDLALSLEVAEHLPDESADIFVRGLTQLSDTVIFSAAIEGQGGQNHLNEQFPDYWMEKFAKLGYQAENYSSEEYWNNPKIEWWYKQNIFVYRKAASPDPNPDLNLYIHPDLFKKKLQEIKQITSEKTDVYKGKISIRQGFKIFIKSIINWFKNQNKK